jgi:hypothetical protein
MYTKFWSENVKGRDHVEDLSIYGRIILERILGNEMGGCELDTSGSG